MRAGLQQPQSHGIAVEIADLALPSSAGASLLPSVPALESGCGAMAQPAQLRAVVEAAKG